MHVKNILPCLELVMERKRKKNALVLNVCPNIVMTLNWSDIDPLCQSGFGSLPRASPVILSIQQPPVLCDLHLQPGLEVEQHVVLLLVLGDAGVQLGQLSLQACDHVLEAT